MVSDTSSLASSHGRGTLSPAVSAPTLPPTWAVLGSVLIACCGIAFAFWPLETSLVLALSPLVLYLALSPIAFYCCTVASFSFIVITLTMTKGAVQYPVRPFDILIILSLFSYAAHRALGTLPRWRPTPVDLPVFALFILALASLSWSHDITRGLYELRNLVAILPFALVVTPAILSSWQRLSAFMWFVIICGAINAAISIFAFYTYPDYLSVILDRTHLYRLVIVFNDLTVAKRGHGFAHPLVTSIWLDVAILFGLAQAMTITNRKKRNWTIVLTLFILCGHLSTMSKGAIVSLVPTFGFLILMQRSWRRFALTSMTLFFLTIAVCFVTVHSADLVKHLKVIESQTTGDTEGSSTSDRLTWWGQSLGQWVDSDFLGVGIGGVFQYLDPWGPHPHSIYVSMVSELSFPGIFLYLLIFAITLSRMRTAIDMAVTLQKRQITLFTTAALINILFYGFFDLYFTEYLVWLLVGVALSCARLVDDDALQTAGKGSM
ncbi:O-antigen ligase family protein [Desulfovibrio inopinatus]|uniref:O-antigen ligase family protein n=1 Tax=Desulfovibrio inopinatus TaxID=102109 RepID=UPI00041D51B0|nr:O-antigen ligase family protein [Desulfovibrio inopinatus]